MKTIKRFAAIILMLTLLVTVLTTASQAAAVTYSGADVNVDGKINLIDILKIRRAVLGGMDYQDIPKYDVNNDGEINASDAMLVRDVILHPSQHETFPSVYPNPDVSYSGFNFKTAGDALLKNVNARFWEPLWPGARENYNEQIASFLWPLFTYIESMSEYNRNTLGEKDADIMMRYKQALDVVDKYKVNSSLKSMIKFAGEYGGAGDVFYDDNSIIGLAYLAAYEDLGTPDYLDHAKKIFSFLKAGVDNNMGGGLYWKESKDLKPTCANGYAAMMCARLYEVTGDREYLNTSIALYEWIRENLKDTDNLYLNHIDNDSIKKPDTHNERYKFTYNTGVMMCVGVKLYELTLDKTYLLHAVQSAESADAHFGEKVNGRYFFNNASYDPWFHSWLLKGYIEISKYNGGMGSYIEHIGEAVLTGWENRTADGFVHRSWSNIDNATGLLYQSGTVYAMYQLDRYIRVNKGAPFGFTISE